MTREWVMLLILLCTAFAATTSSLTEMRMTPDEVSGIPFENGQIDSSNLAGARTKIRFGDPSKSEFYTILLFVPAHTTIAAHPHRDDRMAVVVSGTWNFGYGSQFDERALKRLSPRGVYSEPGRVNHFARTDGSPAMVEIFGFGPTDTVYFDPAHDPASKR
jgi:hypothetical protein